MYKDETQVQGEEVKAVSSVQSLDRFSCKTNRNLKAFHSCSFYETELQLENDPPILDI